MTLFPKLDMRQGQQLVMTPQLQQAIKLLQLTNLELAEFVEEQLKENPFLERDESERAPQRGDGVVEKQADEPHEKELNIKEAPAEATAVVEDYEHMSGDSSPAEMQQAPASGEGLSATDWSNSATASRSGGEDFDPHANLTREKSLPEFLIEQLHLATTDAADLMTGAFLIDLIDEAGYLRTTTDQVADQLGLSEPEVEKVISLIQSFEPAGVGARGLAECLAIQLREKGRLSEVMQRLLDNIDLLGSADLVKLRKKIGTDDENLRALIAEIRSLTPKPGLAFGHMDVQIVVPDVFVHQADDGGWKVELNSETLPRVIANQKYFAKLSSSCAVDEDKSYLKEQIANANWLVKSLDQRAKTILRVAMELVRQQDAFFIHGVRYLKPLNLKAVANAIEMHESTVSRVTSNKYLSTPRGVFEMKYFFTASIGTTAGGQSHSAEAVRQRIKELIDAETIDAVLSDDRLVEILKEENINIARRTVAKYREALRIPSSVQRRRLLRQAF